MQDGELWTLQLAAVACLSIAAKMEEGVFPDNIALFQVVMPAQCSICDSYKILSAHFHQGKAFCPSRSVMTPADCQRQKIGMTACGSYKQCYYNLAYWGVIIIVIISWEF